MAEIKDDSKKTEAEKKVEKISALNRRKQRANSRRVFLDPSTPPILSIVRVVIVTMLILALFSFLQTVLVSITKLLFLVVLAIFFAYLLDPLVKLIQRPFKERGAEKFMPRPLAIGITYLIVFTVLGIGISYLAPRIVSQARTLAAQVPTYTTSIQESLGNLGKRLDRLQIPANVQQQINERVANFGANATEYVTSALGQFAIDLVSYLPWLILIPILAFFMLKDVNFFRVSMLRVFPPGRWRTSVESFIGDVNNTLAAYTRAQLTSCLIIGTLCTLGFYIIGVDYALLLGILAGVLEFIPLIGPVTLALIAIGIALLESPWEGLYVFLFLGTLRVSQDYVIYPRIIREGIHLHPLAIILSVLAGDQVAGIPGVFLSIPIVALLTVVYKHILEHYGSKGFFASWLVDPKEAHAAEKAIEEA